MELANIIVSLLESIKLIESQLLGQDEVIYTQLNELIAVSNSILAQLELLNTNLTLGPTTANINFGTPTNK